MGHRYRIIATCEGPVIDQSGNAENGMIIDFGNVKKYMMDFLDAVFDHGFVVYYNDKTMMEMFYPGQNPEEIYREYNELWQAKINDYLGRIRDGNDLHPLELYRAAVGGEQLKVIPVGYTPTAENLAHHMFDMLKQPIETHYGNDIKLANIRLYETPNGYCDWPGAKYHEG